MSLGLVKTMERVLALKAYEETYRTQFARVSTKAELVSDVQFWEDDAADLRKPWCDRESSRRLAEIARAEIRARTQEGRL